MNLGTALRVQATAVALTSYMMLSKIVNPFHPQYSTCKAGILKVATVLGLWQGFLRQCT